MFQAHDRVLLCTFPAGPEQRPTLFNEGDSSSLLQFIECFWKTPLYLDRLGFMLY